MVEGTVIEKRNSDNQTVKYLFGEKVKYPEFDLGMPLIGFCICHYIDLLSIGLFGLLVLSFFGFVGTTIACRKFSLRVSESETETDSETEARAQQRNPIIELNSMQSN